MTCPTCRARIDAPALAAGSDRCSACAWEQGDMEDGDNPRPRLVDRERKDIG